MTAKLVASTTRVLPLVATSGRPPGFVLGGCLDLDEVHPP